MNLLQHKQQSAGGLLGIALAGALFSGLLVLGLETTSAFAGTQTGTSNDDGDGASGGGKRRGPGPGVYGPDEEAVGTLPTKGKDAAGLKLPRNPGFFLRGPRETLQQAVVHTSGSGYAVVESLPGDTDVQVTFHGEVSLDLDAGLMSFGGLTAGVAALDPVHSTQAAALTDSALLLQASLSVGAHLSLPFADLEQCGALHEGVHVLTSSPLLGRDSIELEAIGGLIRVQQGGPLGL